MRFIIVIVSAQLLCGVAESQTNKTPETTAGDRTITSIITPKHSPRSLPEMIAQSVVIVAGTCEQELPARFFVPGNQKADVVTDRIVRVTAVLKGNVEVDTRI